MWQACCENTLDHYCNLLVPFERIENYKVTNALRSNASFDILAVEHYHKDECNVYKSDGSPRCELKEVAHVLPSYTVIGHGAVVVHHVNAAAASAAVMGLIVRSLDTALLADSRCLVSFVIPLLDQLLPALVALWRNEVAGVLELCSCKTAEHSRIDYYSSEQAYVAEG